MTDPKAFHIIAAELVEKRSDEKYKQLVASLPKNKGFAFDLYQFNGSWYPAHHLQGILHCRAHFRPLESDVLLVTVPKSGTTWLKALVFSLINRGPVMVDAHPLTTNNPQELIPSLETDVYADTNRIPDLSGLTFPRLFSTHMAVPVLPPTILLPGSAGCRIVYLCRDPRDMLVSLWHFSNKLRDPEIRALSLEDALEMFCNGTSPAGSFWDHILGYWKQSLEMPSRVMFLRYEEVKEDTASCLRRLAAFLGCPFSEDEDKGGVLDRIIHLCSFDHLSGLEVNKSGKLPEGVQNKFFFRRGQVGDWLYYLTPEMTLKLDTIIKMKLHASGFNYY